MLWKNADPCRQWKFAAESNDLYRVAQNAKKINVSNLSSYFLVASYLAKSTPCSIEYDRMVRNESMAPDKFPATERIRLDAIIGSFSMTVINSVASIRKNVLSSMATRSRERRSFRMTDRSPINRPGGTSVTSRSSPSPDDQYNPAKPSIHRKAASASSSIAKIFCPCFALYHCASKASNRCCLCQER